MFANIRIIPNGFPPVTMGRILDRFKLYEYEIILKGHKEAKSKEIMFGKNLNPEIAIDSIIIYFIQNFKFPFSYEAFFVVVIVEIEMSSVSSLSKTIVGNSGRLEIEGEGGGG